MKNKMLVSAEELLEQQRSGACLIVDCRYSLTDDTAGYNAYRDAHIPGAVYANLDKDLSSSVTTSSGRHPLPSAEAFSEFLAGIGWVPGRPIVAYDDMGGAFAARLWWLMKYFGYNQAALLDGGFPAWQLAGYPTDRGDGDTEVSGSPAVDLLARDEMVLTATQVAEELGRETITLVDARAPERYRGDVEPLDTAAGHVPGAVNLPFGLHLNQNNQFKSIEGIRGNWRSVGADLDNDPEFARADQLVHMCGSGVTACFNQFAAELAGIQGSRIYAGSWSEWIREPARGLETG